MPTSLFLIEGGVGGHMSHLYDNPKLTFAQLRAIFQAAAQGELVMGKIFLFLILSKMGKPRRLEISLISSRVV